MLLRNVIGAALLTRLPRMAGPPIERQRSLSLGSRGDALARLSEGLLDVLVVGGGITGCGVALQCAARGLATGLVEAGDFAGGTSSRSTKLIHGGLRYLQHFEFDLVAESAHERKHLAQLAPGLVSEFPFLLPFYGNPWQAARLRAGLTTYDLMGGFGGHSRNVGVSHRDLLANFRPVLEGGARGAFKYWDALTDDSRLTIQVAKTAASLGASLANYARVLSIEKASGHHRLVVVDQFGGGEITLSARRVVLACGIWLDELMTLDDPDWEPVLAPAKGIHIFIEQSSDLPRNTAFTLSAPSDGRLIFAIPWYGRLMVGTTDTAYRGPLDEPLPDADGVNYLLEAVSARLPQLGLERRNVIGAQAGIRPLIRQPGAALEVTSRREKLLRSASGLLAVGGGKLTTYRQIARRLSDLVVAELGDFGEQPDGADTSQIPVNRRIGDPPRTVGCSVADPEPDELLAIVYGEGESEVRRIAGHDGGRTLPGCDVLSAEVTYAVAHEMVQTPEDLLARRRRTLLVGADNGAAAARPTADQLAGLLGRSPEWASRSAAEYLAGVTRLHGWKQAGS